MRMIALEWRRMKKKPYIGAGIGMMLFSLFTAMLFLFLPDAELDIAGFKENWQQLTALVSCITLAEFAILGAVMSAKIVLEEYMGKRVLLLFSYPIERGQMFRAKLAITWGTTVVMAFLCNMVSVTIAGIISNLFHVMETEFGIVAAVGLLFYSLGAAVTAGCIGVVALWFGFWRWSVMTVVVSSLLITIPITNLFSLNMFTGFLLGGMTAGSFVISVVVYRLLRQKVRNMEVL